METLPREVLYRRYFSFYLFFHTLYFIISIIEFFMFQNERFAVLYFAAVFMLCVDCINNGFILLRADKPKRCLVFISICGIVSFLVYTSLVGYFSIIYMIIGWAVLSCYVQG